MDNKLTPLEKMQLWDQYIESDGDEGRRFNIKACSDEKLIRYYHICRESDLDEPAEEIRDELFERGYEADAELSIIQNEIDLSAIDHKEVLDSVKQMLSCQIQDIAEINGRFDDLWLGQIKDKKMNPTWLHELAEINGGDDIYSMLDEGYNIARDKEMIKEDDLITNLDDTVWIAICSRHQDEIYQFSLDEIDKVNASL